MIADEVHQRSPCAPGRVSPSSGCACRVCRVCINTAAPTLPYPTQNHLEDKVGPSRACGLQVDEGADPGRPSALRPEAVRSLTLTTGASRLLDSLDRVPQHRISQTSHPGRQLCAPQRPLQLVTCVEALLGCVPTYFLPHVTPWCTGRGGQASRAKLFWAACLRHPSSKTSAWAHRAEWADQQEGQAFPGMSHHTSSQPRRPYTQGASLQEGC